MTSQVKPKREDLVGFKINKETLAKSNLAITDIKNMFHKYIEDDEYVIGLDETFCKESHYHLHFRTKCKFATIQDYKSKHFKNQPTTKLYCAKNYTESQDEVWFAYPIKENVISIGNKLSILTLEPLAKAQREIKKSKHNYHERETYKKEEKQTENGKLSDWITENWFKIAKEYKCVVDYDDCLVGKEGSSDSPYKFKTCYLAQLAYYQEKEQDFPPKFVMERFARNYLVRTKKWTISELYDFDRR